jgi:formylmethanofuran dehydrogenase subunit E
MDIGSHTFQEFKVMVATFHGYPAPGVLLGGYMVELGKAALSPETLFEVIVESKKCLPDAVQLLTLCSVGNNRMKVVNLGRFALSLFDKYTGDGVRVHVEVRKLVLWPELRAWFLKEKAKDGQDAEALLREIEAAGDSVCGMAPIRIHSRLLGHTHMGSVGICRLCGEAYPRQDGEICLGCQGEAPYVFLNAKDCAGIKNCREGKGHEDGHH